jgi:hypothetical protein
VRDDLTAWARPAKLEDLKRFSPQFFCRFHFSIVSPLTEIAKPTDEHDERRGLSDMHKEWNWEHGFLWINHYPYILSHHNSRLIMESDPLVEFGP